jgi:hypothetical protein
MRTGIRGVGDVDAGLEIFFQQDGGEFVGSVMSAFVTQEQDLESAGQSAPYISCRKSA